ncbi:antiviral reverse transcriptase Drt3a [Aeromonas dhakensis]|uniref:antiviral reverse transcriptase Drt3a n=1 Tax=Aeromonas dhakensis TaxID=196024 RepID=UPI000B1AFA45|nr:antiviral reverse transcriptase Drt3a [Aeromonas dhakensis]MBW3733932.1 RNA-directed DNA polymerase [Aeromonas dhakensis]
MVQLSFSATELRRRINSFDRFKYNELKQRNDELLLEIERAADELFIDGLGVRARKLDDKYIFSSIDIALDLVLRQCVVNISSSTPLSFKSRSTICDEIKMFLMDDTPYRVYRLDIKRFFESITPELVIKTLNDIAGLSEHTIEIIERIITDEYITSRTNGLPRGLSISPVISDLVLSNFDRVIKRNDNVFYYSRFVDDIIIITSGLEDKYDFIGELKNELPDGLCFNFKKEKVIDSPEIIKKSAGYHKVSINYLGYKYITTSLTEDGVRKVEIDIADDKVKKIETRIALSINRFLRSGDFVSLLDRIRFLTTNHKIVQKNNARVINYGIYYNYARISKESIALDMLDKFLLSSLIYARHANGTFKLTRVQEKTILRQSFKQGHERKIKMSFSPPTILELTSIWK